MSSHLVVPPNPPEVSWLFIGTLVHVPADPVRLHAWHVFGQLLLQHTPSTQKFDTHSAAAPHVCPFFSLHVAEPLQL